MKLLFLFLLLQSALGRYASAQEKADVREARPDLYRCEGCEAIYEHSFDDLGAHVVIPPEGEPGEKLVIDGVVYQTDGVTPVPGVVIYAHHTNAEGVYPTRGDETGWARRHGYLRGWAKTDVHGRYRLRTIKPGSYPGRASPAHIHLTIKEPGEREYWIDEIVFDGDPSLTTAFRERLEDRGGSGIVRLTRDDAGTWHGTRDIRLEPHPENP